MRTKLLRLFSLLISLGALAGCIYLVMQFPPSFPLSLDSYTIPLFIPVLSLFSLFLFLSITTITNRWMQGLLISAIVCSELLLRYFSIVHWFFEVFLLLLFILLEVLIYQS